MSEEKYLDHRGKKIFYRLIGSGEPVVLIHGFGEDGTVWVNQIEFLKNKFQLIVPDLPGSGQSEMIDDMKPPQPPPKEGLTESSFTLNNNMSIESMAEIIKLILDKECTKASPLGRFGGAVLIGHSMGGYITLAFAKKYPEYLNAFGLFHSSAYPDGEEKKSARRKGIEFIRQHGAFEFLKTLIPNLFAPDSILRQAQNQMPNAIEELIIKGNNFSPAALVSYYEAMMQRPDRTDVLINAKVPVLFIIGKYDNAIPIEDVLKQCHLPEKSYIHILGKSGHMGMMEEPDKSNRILKEFIFSL